MIKERKINFLVFLLLYAVFIDKAVETTVIKLSSTVDHENQSFNPLFIIIFPLYFLEIIFATLQAGFSDFYSRVKTLIVALSATLLSLIFFQFSLYAGLFFLIISIFMKGILGNITPIAWAGLSNAGIHTDFRFNIALSICAIALGSWGPLYISHFVSDFNFYLIILGLTAISILLSIIQIRKEKNSKIKGEPINNNDLKPRYFFTLLKNEFHHLSGFLRNPAFFLILTGFLLAEVSFYQILYREEINIDRDCFEFLPLELGLGYYVGTAILKYSQYSDKKNMVLGLTGSLACIFILFIMSYIEVKRGMVHSLLYGVYSLGFSLFIPSMFSSISKKLAVQEQGKLCGLLDSTDTIASVIAFALVLSFNGIGCTFVLFISLIVFILSVMCFYVLLKRGESI